MIDKLEFQIMNKVERASILLRSSILCIAWRYVVYGQQ